MNELKPCPFCGGKAKETSCFSGTIEHKSEYHSVRCKKCVCGTVGFCDYITDEKIGKVTVGSGRQKAIDVWNTRVEE